MTPSAQAKTDHILWALPCSPTAWEIPPLAVQAYLQRQHRRVRQREKQVEPLQGRVETTSQTSSKPPSSDVPFPKAKRKPRNSGGKRGARPGHPGRGHTLRSPPEGRLIEPTPWACGHGALVSLTPFDPHQGMALPPLEMASPHFVFPQGPCAGCGKERKAQVPHAHQAGEGPHLTALLGALAGMHRTSWRLIQAFCHAVLPLPIRLGALPKVLNRASQAILLHDETIATLARQAPVGSIAATPW